MVSEWGLQYKPNKLEGIWGHNMEGSAKLIDHEVQVLEKSDYFGWRNKMKDYLKKFGVWKIVVNPPVQPDKKTRTAVEKYNKIALKFFMDGLSSSIQESVKDYTFSKDLWFKVEEEYQNKNQDKEKEAGVKDEKKEEKKVHASNTSEGKYSSMDNNFECNDDEVVLTEDEEEFLLKVK